MDPLGLAWTDHAPDWLLQVVGSRELNTFNHYLAGVTDTASLGLSKLMREYAWGEDDFISECDPGYQLGELVGMVADVAALLEKGAISAADDVVCQLGCFTEGTPVATVEGEKPIESLRVGDRVLNTGTMAGEDTPTEVNAAEWCKLVLRMSLPDQPGNAVEVETLRRKAWCQERGVEAGALMPLELEHLGLSGPARILRVESCPEIKAGEGRVVLSTFTHYNTNVYALRLEGCAEVLHPTGRHPLFSVTRGDWVAVNELAEGDLLQTRSGPKKISSLGRKPGMHRVYNLEVEGEHCYFVGHSGVLGHNGNLCYLPSIKKMDIDMSHILSGHMSGGSRVSSIKTLFPDGWSSRQIERAVRDAYTKAYKRLETQGDRMRVMGKSNGINIEMWINTNTNIIETAYPIYR